ncbi:DExH-box ATP-dependent RNA helicase DExH17 [Porphyridium purpureum]|uniref:DNA 3'-5' helicase n=1 Tax=Porphyridium purpureum TaxID=35688 RepID=A0A5J4Z0V3_PORPP|nr:DExH-box ATP-dependent RNA helicase DExH17 [Porphyridium purpureum]|eukprot:POR3685..scf295_1
MMLLARWKLELVIVPLVQNVLTVKHSICHDTVTSGTREYLLSRICAAFESRDFNEVQNECLEAFTAQHNMVICAPTGSGKTAIFELAICRLIVDLAAENNVSPGQIHGLRGCKLLTGDDWSSTADLDAQNGESQLDIRDADIVCSTPEKWDSYTRGAALHGGTKSDSTWRSANAVRLLLVDEVHVVGDKSRGASLEAVVTRMLYSSELLRNSGDHTGALSRLRVIAASATVPNAQDIARWIRAPLDRMGLKVFHMSTRPIRLDHIVLGFREANPWRFDDYLNDRLLDVIQRYSEGKPVLVFCSSRKGTQKAAEALMCRLETGTRSLLFFPICLCWLERVEFGQSLKATTHNVILSSTGIRNRLLLQEEATAFDDATLRQIVPHGVAFHNADLALDDRMRVESLFRRSLLRVICTTTTLAQGVNLPARLVIVKGTKLYEQGKLKDYDVNTVTQMMGRAGRPGMEESGLAVIMTSLDSVAHFERVCAGSLDVVESSLLGALTEHLNAEICRGTLCDLASALEWLKCSFLWVRFTRSPHLYVSAPVGADFSPEALLSNACLDALRRLAEAGFIQLDDDGSGDDEDDALRVHACAPAFVLAKYYISFETMLQFVDATWPADENQSASLLTARGNLTVHILATVSRMREFAGIILRRGEKTALNAVNAKLRFPVNTGSHHGMGPNGGGASGKVKTHLDKIVVMLQASMGLGEQSGQLFSEHASLRAEMGSVCRTALRLLSCWAELLLALRERRPAHFKLARSLFRVHSSLHGKCWWDTADTLRQLPGIGVALGGTLQRAGIDSLDKLAVTHARKIEAMLHKTSPFGANLLLSVAALMPKLEVRFFGSDHAQSSTQRMLGTEFKIALELTISRRDVSALGAGGDSGMVSAQSKASGRAQSKKKQMTFYIVAGARQHRSREQTQADTQGGLGKCVWVDHFRASLPLSTIEHAAFRRRVTLTVPAGTDIECVFGCEELAGLEVIEFWPPRLKQNGGAGTGAGMSSNGGSDYSSSNSALDLSKKFKSQNTRKRKGVTPVETVLTNDIGLERTCKHSCKNKFACKHACCKRVSAAGPLERHFKKSKEAKARTDADSEGVVPSSGLMRAKSAGRRQSLNQELKRDVDGWDDSAGDSGTSERHEHDVARELPDQIADSAFSKPRGSLQKLSNQKRPYDAATVRSSPVTCVPQDAVASLAGDHIPSGTLLDWDNVPYCDDDIFCASSRLRSNAQQAHLGPSSGGGASPVKITSKPAILSQLSSDPNVTAFTEPCEQATANNAVHLQHTSSATPFSAVPCTTKEEQLDVLGCKRPKIIGQHSPQAAAAMGNLAPAVPKAASWQPRVHTQTRSREALAYESLLESLF